MSIAAIFTGKSATLVANGAGSSVFASIPEGSGTPLVGPCKLEVDVFVEDAPTWGAGTLAVQMSPDFGVTWINVTGLSWTAAGGRLTSAGPVPVISATQLRLNLTGATAPSITPNLVVRRLENRPSFQVAFAADGTSATFNEPFLPDALGLVVFGSSFGGGTVKFQVSPDNGVTWYTVASAAANTFSRFETSAKACTAS